MSSFYKLENMDFDSFKLEEGIQTWKQVAICIINFSLNHYWLMPGRTEQEWVQYLQTMMFVEILRYCHYYLLVRVLCWKYFISLYEDISDLRSLVLWFWCDICDICVSNLKTSSLHGIVCVKFRDCQMKQILTCILLNLSSL